MFDLADPDIIQQIGLHFLPKAKYPLSTKGSYYYNQMNVSRTKSKIERLNQSPQGIHFTLML